MRVLTPCGTSTAYKRHRRKGEEPCAACRAANAAYVRERLARPEVRVRLQPKVDARNAARRAARAALRPGERERLMRRVVKAENGCWHWTGGIGMATGYGRAWLRGATRTAHVAMFMVVKGDIPAGCEVDHTCHNVDRSCAGGNSCLHRRCVNPDHLDAVSASINQVRQGRRKTHCPRGHEYTEANTRISKGNSRMCRRCHADRQRARSRAA